jgi:DNA-binding NtrC family response regulator
VARRPRSLEGFAAVKVLLVDDEPRLASTLAAGLRAEGFVVVTAFDGDDGLWHAVEDDSTWSCSTSCCPL